MKTFASDNFSSVDPGVLKYLAEINRTGHDESYDGDKTTTAARKLFREAFGPLDDVLFVPAGTAANILSAKLLVQRPYEAVVTSAESHVFGDETGALAMNTGAHMFTLPAHDGKVGLDELRADVQMRQALEFHSPLPKIVSIANPTELGTIYTPDEIKAIADFCHDNDMFLHVDGCRLPNAAAALGVGLAALTREVGVDVLSFGGAKNGLMCAEAVIVFNAPASDHLRMQKQAMQLVSKMRYISGQFVPYLRDDRWLVNAQHANEMARRLHDGLVRVLGDDFVLTHPLQTNQIFCRLPKQAVEKLRAAGHIFYDWNEPGEVRLVASWDTSESEVDQFIALL